MHNYINSTFVSMSIDSIRASEIRTWQLGQCKLNTLKYMAQLKTLIKHMLRGCDCLLYVFLLKRAWPSRQTGQPSPRATKPTKEEKEFPLALNNWMLKWSLERIVKTYSPTPAENLLYSWIYRLSQHYAICKIQPQQVLSKRNIKYYQWYY